MKLKVVALCLLLACAALRPATAAAQEPDAKTQRDAALLASKALRTAYRENLSEDEKAAGLSLVWSEARFNFVNFDLVPELDWDALYLSYLPRVRQTKTTKEFYNVLEEFLAKLKDGHTNLTYPKELHDEVYARPLLRTRLVEERVLVVRADESLRREGVAPGLEVVAVDGVPVREYAERRVMPFMSASTRQDLETRAYEYWLLRGPAGQPVELTLRDGEGRETKKAVPRVPTAEARKAAAPLPPFEFKMLPGNVAYVALNSFGNDEAAKQFEAKFAEISQSEALVFDVRENGGGNSSVGWRVLGHLTDKYHLVTRWRTRQYRPSFRAWNRLHDAFFYGESGFLPAKVARHYAKPVVVLTSPRTYSAAEDFASAFDVMRRGLIVGEPTGGSTGQPLFFELPGGGNARVTTKRDTYPDGTEFVGSGVQPDRAVRPTVEDLRRGRDSVLEAALELLKKGEK